MLTGEMNDYIEDRLKNPEIKRYVKRILLKDLDYDHEQVVKSKFRFIEGVGVLKVRRTYCDAEEFRYDQMQIYNLVKRAERVCLPDVVGNVVFKLFKHIEKCFALYHGSMFDPLQNEINGARNRSHELMRMFGFDPYEEYNQLDLERR